MYTRQKKDIMMQKKKEKPKQHYHPLFEEAH